MRTKNKNCRKLAALLFSDSRNFFALAGGSLLLALSFILFFASLNSTIVISKRQQTVSAHGKFLGVFSDIDEKMATKIMEAEDNFRYEIFQIQDELYYDDKRFFAGWVSEEAGKDMGVFLKAGVWPEKENEILLEEYLAYQLGISSFPQKVVLQKAGRATEYTVCGMIKNYSGNLPVSYRDANGRKNYPSIITADYETTKPLSLLVLQKHFDMEKAQEDILAVMSLYEKYGIAPEQVCLNQYLDEGYANTEDFERVSLLYTMAVLLLLLLVETVIFRAIFLKGRQATCILKEMGLQRGDLLRAYAWQFGKLLLSVLALDFVLGALWGRLGGHITGYGKLLEKQVWAALPKQLAVFLLLLLILAIMMWDDKTEKNEEAEQKGTYRYLFRRINMPMLLMQSLFLIFVLFSFCMREKFAAQEEEIRVSITAQRMYSYRQVGNYAFNKKASVCYEPESVTRFEDDSDVLDMYMAAETQYASLIAKKGHIPLYFEQLQALYGEDDFLQSIDYEEMLSEEAKQYEVLPWDALEVLVLPDSQYRQLLEENEIGWQETSDLTPKCVVAFPYCGNEEGVARIEEASLITMGRIFLQDSQLLLEKEDFRVMGTAVNVTDLENLIQGKTLCALILSVSEAKKSEIISGYSEIEFRMKETITKERQEELDNKIAMLAASQQGGGSYSTVEEQKEDTLYRNYAAFMGSTMLAFGMLAMGVFVFAHYYVNWEQNKYAYGVFRSMGMPYCTLQSKLFVQYMTGIVVAWFVACFVVEECFGYSVTTGQVILAESFLIILVVACYVVLYCIYRNRRICDMLQNG